MIITAPGPTLFTDPAEDGTLSPSGSINYATGAITIAAQAGQAVSATFIYNPDLPVMGLEDLVIDTSQFPGTLAFDTKYSYNITANAPYSIYDVSFYKNPLTGTYPGYTQKTIVSPTIWNGQDYQQFWTVNYQGALWETNGVPVPFTAIGSNIGMQFEPITGVAIIGAGTPPATATLTIVAHGLTQGDFIFVNEVVGITGINFQTGYVVSANPQAVDTVVVEFPNATLGGAYISGGIAQYLTRQADPTVDCLRWYDGDPTDGNVTNPSLSGHFGWVNFAPPLSQFSYSISDTPLAQYYLVGAKMIVPFNDRLLFLGPVIQTSSANSQIYLPDTIIYSQNGTAYYTASWTNTPNVFTPILTPKNQSAAPNSYFEDSTGFGGFIAAGIDQTMTTASFNEDVLIVGFPTIQTRLIYSGNVIVPFNFFTVNSELGSSSTFSIINLDQGVITRGNRGFIITSQVETRRIDLDIPDEVFEINLTSNGLERICAQRDFINEWIYFTYPSNQISYKFPNQTLQYNYRDDSWGTFYESYTTYGSFRAATGYTWATIGDRFPTWAEWDEPWNSGSSTLLQPKVIAGNQQGFILFREIGTGEGNSLYIENVSFPVTITGATPTNPVEITVTYPAGTSLLVPGQRVMITGVVGMTQLNGRTFTITAATPTTLTLGVNGLIFSNYVSGGIATPPTIYSPDHDLNQGDYILISGVLGTVGTQLNGGIFSVQNPTQNDFSLNPVISSGTYLGGGLIKRMYIPFIQTKQFPIAWSDARKTRISSQQYLLSTTARGQIQLLIYLSQDSENPYNREPIVPAPNSNNNSLIYSTFLSTAPDIQINVVTNSSLGKLGNNVLTTLTFGLPITLIRGSVVITVGSVATFTDNGVGGFNVTGTGVSSGSSVNYLNGTIILVFSVAPNSQASFASYQYSIENIQNPTAEFQEQVWHRINTSLVGDTVQLGFTMSDTEMRDTTFSNQFSEIEIHSIIMDVQPSSILS